MNKKEEDWGSMTMLEKYGGDRFYLSDDVTYDILNGWVEEAKKEFLQSFPDFEMPPIYILAKEVCDYDVQDNLEGTFVGYTTKPVLSLPGKKGGSSCCIPANGTHGFSVHFT